jgi:hypothetical protein
MRFYRGRGIEDLIRLLIDSLNNGLNENMAKAQKNWPFDRLKKYEDDEVM